ncbi:hypothetical protein [Deinococcus sp. RIT780]|uniref:hypothetical protein n=1 Tax=Deinococcus sp. RIT780 TaxID=2870472 RepID=UPI001C89793E|nr:hypothetical protein [Deinococcus sp. RIT780]MBX8464229.1 hypothetical protein [Deinococcus sp. RIT780]
MNGLNVNVGLSGRTKWEVLDARGDTVRSGEWSNLITNAGLDRFADEEGIESGGGAAPPFMDWRGVLTLGTGSAAPVVADTALSARIPGNGVTPGAYGAEQTATLTQPPGAAQMVSRMVRVFNVQAAYNLTEYGLSAGDGVPLSVRELLRDSQGQPVAVSVQAGQQFKLTHDLTLTAALVRTPGAVNVTGAGALAADLGYILPGGANPFWFWRVVAPGVVTTGVWRLTAQDSSPAAGGGVPASVAAGQAYAQAYVPGTYQRARRVMWQPGEQTGQHWGWMLGSTAGGRSEGGWRAALGAALAKGEAQRLTLDFTTSWGRA